MKISSTVLKTSGYREIIAEFNRGRPTGQGQYDNIRPASEDPYGDPADQGQYGNIRPASEDPYGDPADQQNRW